MTRLIPGKTKVQIELFRSVTLGHVVICAIALAMLVFVIISSLPFKLVICIVVAMVAGLLLVRIDDQPNYMFFISILSHFGYNRRFARLYTDEILQDLNDEDSRDVIFQRMQALRSLVDEAEGIVDDRIWPFPGYGDLLVTK